MTTLPTPDSLETVRQSLQELQELVAPHLRPTLAADLQERIWEQCERLQALRAAHATEPVPTAARPRSLPMLLNPFYFTPRTHD